MASSSHSRKKVCYYYDSDIGNYHYGEGHPMKPVRVSVTHNLCLNYGLHRRMEIFRPKKATFEEMTRFHSDTYIKFLANIKPGMEEQNRDQVSLFISDDDCPIFEGLYEFCRLSAGGSLAAAVKLNHKAAEIGINWGGGLHHAKKSEASGFCYVNDIVLSILELLKYHDRVLYLDIDIHHGDGVEGAFYATDRVMTVSFHMYGDSFFPGSGELDSTGLGTGKYYAVNVPMMGGIDDKSYESIFVPVMSKVMETYRPSAIVLQCGADSLTGDRLGVFNLTLKGHGKCVQFMKKYNLPLLLLGGGGYTVGNVARCWTYETAVALETDIVNDIPYNDYYQYFGPDFKLHIDPATDITNLNTTKDFDKIKTHIFENLRMLPCAPGVQMQDIPEDGVVVNDPEEDEKANVDDRISVRASEKRVANENEFSDSEDDREGRRHQSTLNRGSGSSKKLRIGSRAASKKKKPGPNEGFTELGSTPVSTNAKESTDSSSVFTDVGIMFQRT